MLLLKVGPKFLDAFGQTKRPCYTKMLADRSDNEIFYTSVQCKSWDFPANLRSTVFVVLEITKKERMQVFISSLTHLKD